MNIERRFYPRKIIKLDVKLAIDAQTFHTKTINLSLNGVQLQATAELILDLEQMAIQPLAGLINFHIPQGQAMAIPFRLITKRRLNQQQYILGLKFIELTSQQQCQLEEYIRGY